MEILKELKNLSTRSAVSGNECGLSDYLKPIFERYCEEVKIDKFYNVIGFKQGTGENKKRIMITAHIDEIGFLVKTIEKNGFVRFLNVGGIDSRILPAQQVVIHGKKDIPGIIGAKPPHLMSADEARKAVKPDELSIDTGIGTEKLKEYISVGDIITFASVPFELKNNKLSSKAMDNRSGVVTLIETMKELASVKHESDIYFVATTQEEVGLRGAEVSAYNLEPDVAIVVDACHGDMPDASKEDTYILGKGPAVAIGPVLHKKLSRKMIDIAKDENIPYQIDVEPGSTGTEAWATQVSRAGIPTILVSIPVRYMHTTVETVHMNDIKNTARLIARFITKAEKEMEAVLCY